jgi:dTDP-D-glucose 4,6-dehydratase
MVYVNPDTKYNKLFKDFMKKKHFAAVDAWGADESHVKDTFDQLEKFVASNVPEK